MNPAKEKDFRCLVQGQWIWLLLVVLLWSGLLFLIPLDPDYTSGELLDHALAWKETGYLFVPPLSPPYRILNYPPLFLWIVKSLSWTGLSVLSAGRIVNFFALMVCGVTVWHWLRKEGCPALLTWGITALTATSFPILYSSGQFHLELMAVSFTLVGFYLIRDPQGLVPTIISGILFALACFTKQTQAVFAILAVAWLLRYHRRHGVLLIVSIGLLGCLGSAFLQFCFGEEMWRQLLRDTVGSFSVMQGLQQFLSHFFPWLIFFAFAVNFGCKNSALRRHLAWWFFIGSSLWLFSSSRIGASSQYFIEWNFSIILVLGLGLKPYFIEGKKDGIQFSKTALILFLIQILGADLAVAGILGWNLFQLESTVKSAQSICATLPPPPALIPSGDPGLIRFCGRIPALHPFIMSSLAKQGLWDEAPFLHELESGTYPRLLLPFDPKQGPKGVSEERWTPGMLLEMAKNYEVSGNAGAYFLLKYRGGK